MPLPLPDNEVRLNGLLHRKWTFPARRYTDGGVQSERWVYAVGESPFVVTFTAATGRYPEGCDPVSPFGMDQTGHRPTTEGGTCIYLDGLMCQSDGSGIDAHEWYEAQHKNAEGFVHDAVVFAHLRDLYTLWEKP